MFLSVCVLTACGSGDDPGVDGDAGVIQCPAAQVRAPSPVPPRIALPMAQSIGGGPRALPRPVVGPLPVVSTSRPPRPQLRATSIASRVEQRALLLTALDDELSYVAARTAFERIGAPFEVHVATTSPFSDLALFGPDGTCRYSSVVLATDMLGYYEKATDRWLSALSSEEWDTLASYEVVCGAREAIWYAYPSSDLGMEDLSSFDSDEEERGLLTPEGAVIFSYLADAVEIPIQYAYGYRSAITSPSTTTPLVVTPAGEALVVIHQRADGTEVIAVTVSSSIYSVHSQLLEYGVINWLQRGLFLGERRVYLTPQMDDIYLYTDLWKIGASSIDESVDAYRTTAADITDLTAWQRALQASLPEGSSFVTQFPFNGKGTLATVYADTEVIAALDAVEGDYVWINHTWDHADMDEMTFAEAHTELAENCALGLEHGFSAFTCETAITPHVSGLDNPHAVEAMVAAGVRTVVSDTSVTESIRPGNPGTNPSHNVGRRNPLNSSLFQVPRHPTNIFYSTSLDTEEVDLYNFLYRSWQGRDLSYPEILFEDTSLGLSYLLAYDIDPLMFHQGNLRFWSGADARRHSLYTDWIDLLLQRYLALVKLPVITLTLEEVAAAMKRREAFDGCAATAVVVSADGGAALELTTHGWCEVPVTGLDAPELGEVQRYAGVPTTFVVAEPCTPIVVPLD